VAVLFVEVVVVENVALVPPQKTGAPEVEVVIVSVEVAGALTDLLTTDELVQPTACAVNVPPAKLLATATTIVAPLFELEEIVIPAGKFHTYDVAFVTAVIEYVAVPPKVTDDGPEIDPILPSGVVLTVYAAVVDEAHAPLVTTAL
jgi:hypothetical protein